jgi:hypothetical protein
MRTQQRQPIVPKRLGKTGIIICVHCDKACEHEVFTDTHRFLGEREDIVLEFCSPECKTMYFWDELICSEVDERMKEVEKKAAEQRDRVDKEVRWFHARGLCPKCKDRVLRLLHHCK